MSAYTDFLYKFSDVTQGIAGLQAMLAAGVFPNNSILMDALGQPRDDTGAVVNAYDDNGDPIATWRGGKGLPALSYTDPDSGVTTDNPATGDGSSYYVAIRSLLTTNPVDLSSFGMQVATSDESADVLGVWASNA